MQKLWFKRKRYGYGWYPASYEGWITLLIWLVALISNELRFVKGGHGNFEVATFLGITFLSTVALIVVCYKNGEKPRWQWGQKDEK